MKQISSVLLLLAIAAGCQQPHAEAEKELISSKAMCAPVTSDLEWFKGDHVAPLFDGLGDWHFTISTNDTLAQRYFDQGLNLAYGFNHAEAARSFYYATKLDPGCAMAFWGYAYALGPNYNAGMESDHYEIAYKAVQDAIARSGSNTTEKEKDLIEALVTRYVKLSLDDRSDLDKAYADRMMALHAKYPNDADIGALYAESLMNLHPWDLHDKAGNEKEWTPEIIGVLEDVISQHPRHPGAHHFYIHAVEASNAPHRGLQSAKLFDEGLVPNAGHLVHMPSHVYIRTGDYHKGTMANKRAIKVDSLYITACHAQGAYPLAYYPHNQHFMAATATLEGNSQEAIYAAEALQNNSNKQLMKEPGWGTVQHYYTIPYYVYVKFGKWDKILAIENDVPELDYPTAILHYAKGMAYLGKGNLPAAKTELKVLEKLTAKDELKEITIWEINSVFDLVQIAHHVLAAEVLSREGEFEKSLALLKEAIVLEDALNYNEPPDWFFSVRHNLGAVQIEAGQHHAAIQTYKDDLKNLPKNGWALKGLLLAYSGAGDLANQRATEIRFKESWLTADINLTSSVIK